MARRGYRGWRRGVSGGQAAHRAVAPCAVRAATPGSDGIARLCYDLPAVDPWCSGPTCLPVTQEIAGSNPVGSAIQPPLNALPPIHAA
jgi:hypothetical protein